MSDFCQIRKGYRAQWRDFAFFVEGETARWTLRVHRAEHLQPLYSAERCGIAAARAAAVEFGVFCALGPASAVIPSQLAGELNWQEYW